MRKQFGLLAGLALALAASAPMATALPGAALAQTAQAVDPAVVARVIKDTFRTAPAEWQARIEPDEAQRVCSQFRNNLPAGEFDKALAREKTNIVLPGDGNVIGDWKRGRQLAQRGTGGQFSDRPDTPIGGNCYACHQLSPAELSFGTLGPSLLEYGKVRKYAAEEARIAYVKIYNAQASMPCSNMPRFGHSKFLNEQQIKDLVAYLFDPESPVNK